MSFLIGHAQAVVGKPGDIHTEQKNDLGTEAVGSDGITYVYLKGIGSTILGSWVTFDTAGLTALLAANAKGPVAIATAATVADTYGWYVRDTGASSCSAAITGSSAASGDIGRETTDGYAGDGRAAGDKINGAIAPANAGSSAVVAGVRVFRPYVDDASGS